MIKNVLLSLKTIFDQKKEEITINSADNENSLATRKMYFFKKNINILKQEEQIIVNSKESNIR
ncbi:hypothetical protein [Empedobacter sp. UBA6745]|uniref:hypothetical protein n=1 Tax=Empedobacter sp. UBA6745 TaxID=1946447 RepID=UPI0025BF8275|nr:hypothetical protein [Empedobacter sp. UBA6745]